jgi:hypothetical protein
MYIWYKISAATSLYALRMPLLGGFTKVPQTQSFLRDPQVSRAASASVYHHHWARDVAQGEPKG